MTDRDRDVTAGASAPSEEVVITRVFDAPRSLVWKAWTEPESVARWWGPRVFTAPVCKIDLRVGGEYHYCMRSPDGHDFWSKGSYLEVVPPERIVATDSFADAEGNTVPASYYGMPGDWPLEMVVTVSLEDLGAKTRLTLEYSGSAAAAPLEKQSMVQGWDESLDKLAEHLAS